MTTQSSNTQKRFECEVKATQAQSPASVGVDIELAVKLMFNSQFTVIRTAGRTIIVVDRSGSMQAALQLLKSCLKKGVELLPDGDVVGVLAFDGNDHPGRAEWNWLMKPAVLDTQSRQVLLREIDDLETGSMTRYYEPVDEGLSALSQLVLPAKTGEQGTTDNVKKFVLFLDGQSTVAYASGIGPDEDVTADLFANHRNVKSAQVELYAMGPSYTESVVKRWAKAANGQYYHVTQSGADMDARLTQSFASTASSFQGKTYIRIVCESGFELKDAIREKPQYKRLTILDSGSRAVDEVGAITKDDGLPYLLTFTATLEPALGRQKVATVYLSRSDSGAAEDSYELFQDFTEDMDAVMAGQDEVLGRTFTATGAVVDATMGYDLLLQGMSSGNQSQQDEGTKMMTRAMSNADDLPADLLLALQGLGVQPDGSVSVQPGEETRQHYTRLMTGADALSMGLSTPKDDDDDDTSA